MLKVFGTVLVLLAGLGVSTADAGFRSPESLVRNVYAYYGDRPARTTCGLQPGATYMGPDGRWYPC